VLVVVQLYIGDPPSPGFKPMVNAVWVGGSGTNFLAEFQKNLDQPGYVPSPGKGFKLSYEYLWLTPAASSAPPPRKVFVHGRLSQYYATD
jgi:hypothetical protein